MSGSLMLAGCDNHVGCKYAVFSAVSTLVLHTHTPLSQDHDVQATKPRSPDAESSVDNLPVLTPSGGTARADIPVPHP